MKKLLILFLILLLFACEGSPMASQILTPKDRVPPVLLSHSIEGDDESSRLMILFDEPSLIDADTIVAEPECSLSLSQNDQEQVFLDFANPCLPGQLYTLRFDVSDQEGNSNWFILTFYGPNPHLPDTLLNEISILGTSSRPDMIEFYVREGGNTAGLTLFLGIESLSSGSYIFPSIEVTTGEYIILHCRPEGGDEEVSELGDDLSLSGGVRAVEGVRDLWVGEDLNLPGTSGILSLLTSPLGGDMMDRIVYTNRTADPLDQYLGWTSTLWSQVEEMSLFTPSQRGWVFQGEYLLPEEAVSSSYSTSTRTLCRSSLSEDSDSWNDWHTGITSGSSFGEVNSDDLYEP